ncbi:uncharacterized protein LOC144164329 [Haemaphysalis longicornis]
MYTIRARAVKLAWQLSDRAVNTPQWFEDGLPNLKASPESTAAPVRHQCSPSSAPHHRHGAEDVVVPHVRPAADLLHGCLLCSQGCAQSLLQLALQDLQGIQLQASAPREPP